MNSIEIISKVMQKYKDIELKPNVLYEYELMKIIIKEPESHPKKYAKVINEIDSSIAASYDGVMQILNKAFSANPKQRKQLVEDAKEISTILYKFCFYNNHDNEFYNLLKGKVFKYNKKKLRDKIILYFFFSEIIDNYNINYNRYIKNLNYRTSSNCLANIVDNIAEISGLRKKHDVKEKVSDIQEQLKNVLNEKSIETNDIAELKAYIEDLRNSLELVEDQLTNYQTDLESYKEEIQVAVISDFIQTLNSDKYGNLLDNFVKCQKKLRQLKKNGYEFPNDVESIPLLIRQYVKFIKDFGIKEIQTLEFLDLNYDEAQKSQYIGTSFLNKDDIKQVSVESSGWKYKDIIISIPKYVELN